MEIYLKKFMRKLLEHKEIYFMKNLSSYLFKNVKVTEKTGEKHIGYVDTYTPAFDNEEEKDESIGIMPTKDAKYGIELFRYEIEDIEEI